MIDFTTSAMSAEPSVALQDANVLCVNHRDAEDTVTVLPVAGYGEEDMKEDKKMVDDLMDAGATVRGDRPWREVTGGATVACSQCHAPLGFASLESPETFRLLKHRLCIPDPSGGGGSCRMSLCASFLAREMVRYAEAKAIFTFLVALQTPKMGFASSSFTKCILLRLVSWDCSIATNLDERSKRPKFGRFAKIVFEETYDKRETKVGSWMWGGVDLCCPPMDDMDKDVVAASEEKPDDMERKISTVRILLQKDEYGQTLQSLRDGQQFFTRAVANATILAKMGTMPKSKGCTGGLGLAAIDLSS